MIIKNPSLTHNNDKCQFTLIIKVYQTQSPSQPLQASRPNVRRIRCCHQGKPAVPNDRTIRCCSCCQARWLIVRRTASPSQSNTPIIQKRPKALSTSDFAISHHSTRDRSSLSRLAFILVIEFHSRVYFYFYSRVRLLPARSHFSFGFFQRSH